jgi:integrase
VASVARRPDGRWRARYRDLDGKEHSRHFDKKQDGQRWLDEVTASLVTGQYADPRAGRQSLKSYAASWERSHVTSPAGRRIADNALRCHVIPALGERQLATIRRSDVQRLVKDLSARLSPGSVRNIVEVLARVMESAVDDRVIAVSPCARVALPSNQKAEVTPPTSMQVLGLADAITPRYRAAVVMLAGSGLRIGELLGLRVADIDWLRRTVRVERQRLQDGSVGLPKTSRSIRTVPLAQVVVDELAAHLGAFPSDEWLFTNSSGEPVGYRTWKSAWSAANLKVGLDVDTHGLRHAFASALISGGASVKQVQTVLGHANAAITLKTYSHMWPGDEDRTRSIVDAVFDVLRTGCGLDDLASGKTAGQEG